MLFLASAVDVIARADGRVTFVTPAGAFTLDDPQRLVGDVVKQCRAGLDRADIVAAPGTPEARAAVESLVNLLERRRVLEHRPACSPETPGPETRVPETPVPERPVPERPVPKRPVPKTHVDETPVDGGPRAVGSRAGRASDLLAEWIRYPVGGAPAPPGRVITVLGNGQLARHLADRLDALGLTWRQVPTDGQVPAHALTAAGHMTGDDQAPGVCLWIGAADWPDPDRLRSLNREAVRRGVAFMPVWVDRARLAWGPLVEPGATGCVECLHHRMAAMDRPPPGAPPRPEPQPGISISSTVVQLAAGFAAAEAARWAVDGYVNFDCGVAWSLDLLTLAFHGGRVLRLPRCPVCGVPAGDTSVRREDVR